MPSVAFSDLAWSPAPMPDSTGDVLIASLPTLADRAFRAFVRFPPGWARVRAGSYSAAEEILVLEGELAMNGVAWGEGAHVWAPAGAMRTHTASPDGCLAFAWFAAPPRWRRGSESDAEIVGLRRWRDASACSGRFGGEARLLRSGDPHESWLLADDWEGEVAAATEWLRLADRAWGVAAAGERLAVAAPAFLRVAA